MQPTKKEQFRNLHKMFSCRFDVSEIELEVAPSSDHSTKSMVWDLYSVLVQRDGLMETRQQTRWLDIHSLPSSVTAGKPRPAEPPVDESGPVRSPESHRLFSPSELNQQPEQNLLAGSSVEATSPPLLLTWAACNAACCVVDLRPIPNSNPCRVDPKTNHPLVVSVIVRTNGGIAGSPLSPGRNSNSSFDSLSQSPKTTLAAESKKRVPLREKYGHYVCQVSCDFSEVFNSPTGRQEYRLRVKPQDVTCPSDPKIPGTPLYVRFSVAARKESLPTPAKMFYRNYHDSAILLDQFIVDLRDKKRTATTTVAPSASCATATLYRLGICVDTTNGIHKMKRFTLLFDGRAFPAPEVASDSDDVAFIDFSSMAAASHGGGLSMSSSFGPIPVSSPQLVSVSNQEDTSGFAINSESVEESSGQQQRVSETTQLDSDGPKLTSDSSPEKRFEDSTASPPSSPLTLPATVAENDNNNGVASPGLSFMRASTGAADTVLIYSSNTTLFQPAAAPKHYVTFESRFKTDLSNGLCKSSKKCQVAFSLFVTEGAHSTMHVMREEDLLDLSTEVLSAECFPEDGRVRSMKFPYGETLYFRIRRVCFEAPKHYNMKQFNL